MNKLLTIILLLSMSVAFGACSSDDDKEDDKFVWEGDIEGYNPLEGVWRYKGTKVGLLFDSEKTLYRLDFKGLDDDNYTKIGGSKFQINKTAYQVIGAGISRYKIVNDNEFIRYPNQNNDDNASTLIRVE